MRAVSRRRSGIASRKSIRVSAKAVRMIVSIEPSPSKAIVMRRNLIVVSAFAVVGVVVGTTVYFRGRPAGAEDPVAAIMAGVDNSPSHAALVNAVWFDPGTTMVDGSGTDLESATYRFFANVHAELTNEVVNAGLMSANESEEVAEMARQELMHLLRPSEDHLFRLRELGFSGPIVSDKRLESLERRGVVSMTSGTDFGPEAVSVHIIAVGGSRLPLVYPDGGTKVSCLLGTTRANKGCSPLGETPVEDGALVIEVRFPMIVRCVLDLDQEVLCSVGLRYGRSSRWYPYEKVVYSYGKTFVGQLPF